MFTFMFMALQEPPFDPLSFSKGVTYDASEAAGSPPGCVDNVKRAWQVRAMNTAMYMAVFMPVGVCMNMHA
jgi:hypothetical protein